jgi:hypothetical protein
VNVTKEIRPNEGEEGKERKGKVDTQKINRKLKKQEASERMKGFSGKC